MSLPPFRVPGASHDRGAGERAGDAPRREARILAGGTDLINWHGARGHLARTTSSTCGRCRASGTSRTRTGQRPDHRRRRHDRDDRALAVIRETYFSLHVAARPDRLAPGARHGHHRRQLLQRLALRRHAAAAGDPRSARVALDESDAAGGRCRSRTSSRGNRQTGHPSPTSSWSAFVVPGPVAALGQPLLHLGPAGGAGDRHRQRGREPGARSARPARSPMSASPWEPWRRSRCAPGRPRSSLQGQEPGDEIIDRAAESCGQECRPIDDLRASASYRRHVVRSPGAAHAPRGRSRPPC